MNNKSGMFLVMFVFAIILVATNRFENPTQELVGSSDVLVRAGAPTADDDIDFNILKGMVWIDTSGGAAYINEDNADGAAVWTDITAAGSTWNAEEDDSLELSSVGVLNLGSGLDGVDAGGSQYTVTLDYAEDPVNLSGSDVTGTLDLSDHVNLSAGTGATLTGDSLSVDLGTAIDTSEITDGTILEADLAAVDTASDEECLTFEATGGDFEWQACASGGSGTLTTIKEGDSAIGDPDIVALDFGAGFDCTESPNTEINCVLDYTEDPVDLSGAEVTGTLDISDHTNLAAGTGATLTGDSLSVDLGTAIDTSEITDGTILEADLAAVDSASDEECLTFEATVGDFEWQACSSGGSGTLTTVKQDNVQVGDADIVAIDFGDGFTCTESPDTEINCTVDLGESIDISDETNLSCGTNCTLTGDEISVDDAFILNTGDVGTGAYDFGGATDFEIPNGTSETPNAAGEIAVDTTGDQIKYFGAAERVVTFQYTKSFALSDPADADSILIWEAPFNITILSWSCIVDPGDTAESVVVDLQETDATGDTGASIDASVTCDNDEANDDGSLSNATIDAGDYILLDVGTVTGTVSWLSVSVVYTVDPT